MYYPKIRDRRHHEAFNYLGILGDAFEYEGQEWYVHTGTHSHLHNHPTSKESPYVIGKLLDDPRQTIVLKVWLVKNWLCLINPDNPPNPYWK